MSLQLAPSEDIGLQHILENGLTVIRLQPFEEPRRAQVLNNLYEILSEAVKGSRALEAKNLLFAVQERLAFERFSFFYKYLTGAFGNDVPARLREALEVVTDLQQGRQSDLTRRKNAEEFIGNLLGALHRERALAPLVPPTAVEY